MKLLYLLQQEPAMSVYMDNSNKRFWHFVEIQCCAMMLYYLTKLLNFVCRHH